MSPPVAMSAPLPTDAELMIIRALWKLGPSTVRQVWDELNTGRETPVVYTTVLKAMQVMHEKGILQRDDSARSHIYRPAAKPETVKRSLVRDLMDRLFDGSARELVVEALGSKKISQKELTEIRKLLDQLDP
jgi:predicted transcriptional regulator